METDREYKLPFSVQSLETRFFQLFVLVCFYVPFTLGSDKNKVEKNPDFSLP